MEDESTKELHVSCCLGRDDSRTKTRGSECHVFVASTAIGFQRAYKKLTGKFSASNQDIMRKL